MKTKFTSQTTRKLTKKVILLAITALALFASPGVALATDCLPQTTWTDSAGSWFTAGNWNNGVPSSGTAALINNGGTAQITASLPVANACSLTLGPNATQSGNVSVSIGTLQVNTSVVVGDQGTGSLSVTNGGSVTSGAMSVGGTTSGTGTGLLTVTDSATVTATSVVVNGSGTLTGNGTVSTTNGTTIYGTLAPSGGRLTMSSGNLSFIGSAPLMESKVTPTSQDNVYVSAGAASLTGRLSVSMSGTFTPGATYTLLHANVRNGTFSSVSINYPTCQCFTPEIQYDAHNVNLYLKPAPCCQ
jgi:T5SS/PEP-CTERM-associated repeat protein